MQTRWAGLLSCLEASGGSVHPPPPIPPHPPSFSPPQMLYMIIWRLREGEANQKKHREERRSRERERRTVRRKLGNKTTLEVRAYLNRLHQTCDYSVSLLMKFMIKSAALDLRFFPLTEIKISADAGRKGSARLCVVVCCLLLHKTVQHSVCLHGVRVSYSDLLAQIVGMWNKEKYVSVYMCSAGVG